jgi:hypothetical protein
MAEAKKSFLSEELSSISEELSCLSEELRGTQACARADRAATHDRTERIRLGGTRHSE